MTITLFFFILLVVVLIARSNKRQQAVISEYAAQVSASIARQSVLAARREAINREIAELEKKLENTMPVIDLTKVMDRAAESKVWNPVTGQYEARPNAAKAII